MRSLRQTVALTAFGLRSIPARLGASLVTVIGIMTVVAVLLSLLSMGEGAQFWETGQTRPDRAVVLSHGHFDHTTGLSGLVRVLGRNGLPAVLHPEFWSRRRFVIPGREPLELPTTSAAIEGLEPSRIAG